MKIILITGTKGKTSLALMLNAVLLSTKKTVICVSSEGIIKNGRTVKNNEYFLKKYETSANVVALNEISHKEASRFDYIILESSYSSGKKINFSFAKNNVDLAILTNVYWDHIDGRKIRNQKELFNKKLTLVKNLKLGGTAIIYTGNKKESLAHKAIGTLEKERNDLQIISFQERNLSTRRLRRNIYSIKDNFIYFNNKKILNINNINLPFKKYATPLRLNLVALVSALTSLSIPPSILTTDIDLSIPGRLNIFSKNNYSVVLDYAHEIRSLSLAAALLRKKFKDKKL